MAITAALAAAVIDSSGYTAIELEGLPTWLPAKTWQETPLSPEDMLVASRQAETLLQWWEGYFSGLGWDGVWLP